VEGEGPAFAYIRVLVFASFFFQNFTRQVRVGVLSLKYNNNMPPIAWPEAKKLWNESNDKEAFLIAYHKYDRAIKTLDAKQMALHEEGKNKTKIKLVEKNRLICDTITKECRKRGHMTLAEVKAVYAFKMTRGKYRPMLMKYPDEWNAKAIETQTKKAFELCSLMNETSDFRNAKKIGNVLSCFLKQPGMRGIGTATASLILSIYDSRFPFLSDEALAVVIPSYGKDPYTPLNYVNFVSQIQKKRARLLGEKNIHDKDALTHSDIEKALWTVASVNLEK
jgi:hypothetical protein